MITVNINTLKAKLSEYLNIAREKQEIITIVNRNIPIAEIKFIENNANTKREFGLYKEKVKFNKNFSKPNKEIEEMFYKSI
jgi:antitoxin (DNA-binding transcriptional repressor) of toxin-antitoxin stability system